MNTTTAASRGILHHPETDPTITVHEENGKVKYGAFGVLVNSGFVGGSPSHWGTTESGQVLSDIPRSREKPVQNGVVGWDEALQIVVSVRTPRGCGIWVPPYSSELST